EETTPGMSLSSPLLACVLGVHYKSLFLSFFSAPRPARSPLDRLPGAEECSGPSDFWKERKPDDAVGALLDGAGRVRAAHARAHPTGTDGVHLDVGALRHVARETDGGGVERCLREAVRVGARQAFRERAGSG